MRAVIFDCFGVLYVDVSQAYFAHFPELSEELHDLNRMADHGFIDRNTYIEGVAKLTGVSTRETTEAFAREHRINQPLIDYIKSTLKPSYKIGLLSNIGRDWMQDFFDQHALHELFDTVVMSSEEGITKPNPLIFERTAERLGVPADECVMIDDIKENCEGARATGMKALLYDTWMTPEVIGKEIQRLGESHA
jgi:HAD superfamily hydrolase (TIGR01509 family)